MDHESPDRDTRDSAALEEQLAEAARLTEAGDVEAAFELLLQLETDHPEDPTLLCMLGALASEADAPGAYDYFRRSLAAHPADPAVLAVLGAGLARFDDPDAESTLRLAAITAPQLALARLRYGSYLAREGFFDEAIAELEAARALEPGDEETARELAVAHLLAGADARAADLLESVGSESAPPDTHLLRGLALLRLRKLSEAAEELHRSAEELPEDGEVQLLAALACATQGWMDEAWNSLARAEGAPSPPDAGLLEEAEEALETSPAAAEELLLTQIAPSVLRMRLVERA